MSAVPTPTELPGRLRPMANADLETVMAAEVRAYSFPWTRGNFADSLAAGHLAEVRVDETGHLLAYYVAMPGVDELHLLNLTVAPAHQGRGHARALLQRLCELAQARKAQQVWLEVRASNARARALYIRFGFAEVGQRRAYYPAGASKREDAIVMRLNLPNELAYQGEVL